MVSKSQLLKDDKSKDAHTASEAISGLNRRQFLCQIGISAGAGLLMSQSISQALASNTIELDNTLLTKDDLPTVLMDKSLPSKQAAPETLQAQTSCITPSTRNCFDHAWANALPLSRRRLARFVRIDCYAPSPASFNYSQATRKP